eukprot:c20438_g1_i1.p1 GENE.c20438_g1_i1~~c20438_g1_i1.p1  ORF type:complete len:839 (-),score=350.68 c20438_g1_i1:58-2526(-)
MNSKFLFVCIVLTLVSLVISFDPRSLSPEIEESSLTQILNSLKSTVSAKIGRQYHEVLTAEELLTKMRNQIQDDQSADFNTTTHQLSKLEDDITYLSNATIVRKNELQSLKVLFDESNTQLNSLKKQNDDLESIMVVKGKEIQETINQCQSIKQRHDVNVYSFVSDSNTLSKIIHTVDEVECDQLSNFIQQMSIPQSVSFLSTEVTEKKDICDCVLLSQMKAERIREKCECNLNSGTPNPVDGEVEWTCDLRKENVKELLRALLEQVYASSSQETKAFKDSYEACYNDVSAQDSLISQIKENLKTVSEELSVKSKTFSEIQKKFEDAQSSLKATEDALSSSQSNQKLTQKSLNERSELRKRQYNVISSILQLLAELTQSEYADRHFEISNNKCPNLCSSHGICFDDACHCDSNYIGADCSISVVSRQCPFKPNSSPCKSESCKGINFEEFSNYGDCSDVVCSYCKEQQVSDSFCSLSSTALVCAQLERASNCSTISCDAAEPSCGINRIVKTPYTGCCFNAILDCQDKCQNIECPRSEPSCPTGMAVRYPFRDCCFNQISDCVDECAVQKCSSEAPTCPIGQKVRTPYVGCCFNAQVDCEDECTTVICPAQDLPIDVCRSQGKRWSGSISGCCFNAQVDCIIGDDKNQKLERVALVSLFNATNGMFWYRQQNSQWLSDLWICFWDGVECSGKAGDMHVTALSLKSNGLTGIIPAEISGLQHLVILDLSDNSLVGEVPKELAQLSNLQTLKLRNNLFQGAISSDFAKLPSLQIFDIGNNFFNGTLPAFSSETTSVTCSENCFCSGSCGPRRISSVDKYMCSDC